MTSRLRQIFPELGRRVLVMGIINVTPDSFSDGGRFTREDAILSQAEKLVADGADLLDIGGESTRPGALPVPPEEETRRVLAAVKTIRLRHDIPISVDTTKSSVAQKALDAGADIVNDISALRFDPELVRVVREYRAPLIIMHMQGTPGNMQNSPNYADVIEEISRFLEERLSWAESQGLDRQEIVIDPGLGFGKTLEHNLTILKHADRFAGIGNPLLIGHSRKSFIGKILNLDVDFRDQATAILSGYCATKGADFVRVHDVGATMHALRLMQAVHQAPDR